MPSNTSQQSTPTSMQTAAAATMAAIPADTLAFPFARIKTLMMTQRAGATPGIQLQGTWNTASNIYQTAGIRGFYRGFAPVIILTVPATIGFFGAMEGTQRMLGTGTFGNLASGVAGQIAGGLLGWVPAAVISEVQQTSLAKPELQRLKSTGLVMHVLKTEGAKGLYRGFSAQFATYAPFNAAGIAVSAEIKARLFGDSNALAASAIANGIGFGGAAAVTTPIDVVKTRLQVVAANPQLFPDKSIMGAAKRIYQEGGARAFFDGTASRVGWLGVRQAAVFTLFGAAMTTVMDATSPIKTQEETTRDTVVLPKGP